MGNAESGFEQPENGITSVVSEGTIKDGTILMVTSPEKVPTDKNLENTPVKPRRDFALLDDTDATGRTTDNDETIVPPEELHSPRTGESSTLFGGIGPAGSHDGAVSLMETSAAVFHLLAEAQSQEGDDENRTYMSENVSVTDHSAAVFKYLEEESRHGNIAPIVSFLETASAVSAFAQGDLGSVTGEAAAVFSMLEEGTVDERSITDRSFHLFKMLDDARSVDVRSVDARSISERSAAVFKMLDDCKSVDTRSVTEFSAAVFKILEEVKSADAASVSDMSSAVVAYKQNNDDNISISDRSAAVFKMLDDLRTVDGSDNKSVATTKTMPTVPESKPLEQQGTAGQTKTVSKSEPKSNEIASSRSDGAVVGEQRSGMAGLNSFPSDAAAQNLDSMVSPRSDVATREPTTQHRSLSNDSSGKKESLPVPKVATASQEGEKEGGGGKGGYPMNDMSAQPKTSGTNFAGRESSISAEPYHSSYQPDVNYEDELLSAEEQFADGMIDLEFVESFDTAFNEFIAKHPNFLMESPNLVHNIRVAKLQRLLDYNDVAEEDLQEDLEKLKINKARMEKDFHQRLKDASQKKAAHEINLQSELTTLQRSTKNVEGKLMWDLMTFSERRAKKQFYERQKCKNSAGYTKADIIDMVPTDVEGQALRDAILAPPSGSGHLSDQQEKDLRHFQVDNAFLLAEVNLLAKKLNYQKLAAKKYAWVESVLLRIDQSTLTKLHQRYKAKLGVGGA